MVSVDPEFLKNAGEYRRRGWWRDRTLVQDFLEHAEREPQKEAIVSVSSDTGQERRLTYGELKAHSHAFARLLVERKIGRGDFVAIQLPNCWEFTAITLACYLIGAIVCPIIPILRQREVRFILDITRAKIVFTRRQFRRFGYADMYADLVREADRDCDIVVCEDVHLATDRTGDLATLAGPQSADEMAEVLFTSGTTGEPKGVLHTHNTEFARSRAFFEPLGLRHDDVVFMSSTMGHSSGFLYGLCVPMMLGMKAVYLDIHEPGLMLDLMEREGVTWSMGSTTFLVDAVSAQTAQPRDLRRLRLFASGGAPIPPEIVRRSRDVLGTRVIAIWGMTENGGVTATPEREPFEAAAESDGLPCPWMELKVVDDEGKSVPTGVTGHLRARGASQTPGYLARQEDYRACLDAEGWFDTGDLGYLNARGFIRINGRAKDVIIRGGENIPVVEVEAAIYRMPEIKEVAVVAYPDTRLGERACAVVTLNEGSVPIALDDIIAHLAALRMSKTYFPERLMIVEALPKTMSGKIQKFALREALTREMAASAGVA
jgi:cyclohexanecarboxylate-CoA ligase